MSLKDRIETGTTTVQDAKKFELANGFALGVLRRGAFFLALFLVIGFVVGTIFGVALP